MANIPTIAAVTAAVGIRVAEVPPETEALHLVWFPIRVSNLVGVEPRI